MKQKVVRRVYGQAHPIFKDGVRMAILWKDLFDVEPVC